ncbi:MAG: rhomboid family intramembrane serine protease [Chitinophagaceae bacterium]
MKDQNKRGKILLGEEGNALIMLITINVVVFVLLQFIWIVFNLGKMDTTKFEPLILNWFSLSPKFDVVATRPWTIFTYMFSHFKVWMLIGNMLWLWAFGYILQDLTGNRKLGPIYIYGGLAGALFFILTINVFPALYQNMAATLPMLGGGASIMAVTVATTTLAPDYRIFPMIHGGIPLWVLTLIFVLVDFAMIGSAGAGIAIGHLAGAAMGFVYVKRLRAGKDMGQWMQHFYHWFFHMFDPKEKQQAERIKKEVFYDVKGKQPYKKTPNVTQQKIDDILDKIGKDGYHFLSDEEKEYLKRASKDL